MESEKPSEGLSPKEAETLDKIIDKLLAVKRYVYLFIFSFNIIIIAQQ